MQNIDFYGNYSQLRDWGKTRFFSHKKWSQIWSQYIKIVIFPKRIMLETSNMRQMKDNLKSFNYITISFKNFFIDPWEWSEVPIIHTLCSSHRCKNGQNGNPGLRAARKVTLRAAIQAAAYGCSLDGRSDGAFVAPAWVPAPTPAQNWTFSW